MSTQIESQPSAPPAKEEFPKIDKFFRAAEYFVKRSDEFLSNTELAMLRLFLRIHLIIDLVIVLVFLLSK